MKNIVITGANRGIGLELVRQFSKDNFVYALSRSEFPTEELNERVKVVRLDVTDEGAISNFAKELDDNQIAIDLLINNAGMAGEDEHDNPKVDAQTVTEIMSVNAVAPMVMSLHLLGALKRASSPVMIAISSRMGSHALLDDYNATYWPYSASKAALNMAVSAFAINEPEIKSISVHPGWVRTRMGGDDADIDVTESVRGIVKLYESIDTLESGGFYDYQGKSVGW